MRRALLVFVPLVVVASLAAVAGRGRAARVAVGSGSDTTVYAQDVTIAPGQTGDTIALCPGGWRAVSGGVGATTSPAPAHQIQASWPVGDDGVSPAQEGAVARGWKASVYNYGQSAGAFRVFALCSATSDANVQTLAVLGPSAHLGTNFPCQDESGGTHVSGGGVAISGTLSPPPDYVISSAPVGPASDYWSVAVHQLVPERRTYTVFALCSAKTAGSVVEAEARLPASGFASKSVDCPAGRRVIGGGGRAGTPAEVGLALDDSGPNGHGGAVSNTLESAYGWTASAANVTDSPATLTVYAICVEEAAAPPPPPSASPPPPASPSPPPSPSPSSPKGPRVLCLGKRATIVGTAGEDTLKGTRGPDVIAGRGGNDTITALAGNDLVCGGPGDDTINLGAGNDSALGGLGDDTISGGPGNDTITGGPGKDTIAGGPGKNTIKP